MINNLQIKFKSYYFLKLIEKGSFSRLCHILIPDITGSIEAVKFHIIIIMEDIQVNDVNLMRL